MCTQLPGCVCYAETPRPSLDEVVRDAWSDLVEKDDRTSPEDYPDMALITEAELREFMERVAQISR